MTARYAAVRRIDSLNWYVLDRATGEEIEPDPPRNQYDARTLARTLNESLSEADR